MAVKLLTRMQSHLKAHLEEVGGGNVAKFACIAVGRPQLLAVGAFHRPDSQHSRWLLSRWVIQEKQKMPKMKFIILSQKWHPAPSVLLSLEVIQQVQLTFKRLWWQNSRDMKIRRQKSLGVILEGTDHKLNKTWLISVTAKKCIEFIPEANRKILVLILC